MWSQGITSRPACAPRSIRMPAPGPVAYQVHPGSFTSAVISSGADQVTPWSSLRSTQIVRVPSEVPAMISDSWSWPRFLVERSTIAPSSVTTGQGLPQVFAPSSQTTVCALHVRPPSADRLATRSMSPVSPELPWRASAKASSSPFAHRTIAGIR